jgi:hypothetical protein
MENLDRRQLGVKKNKLLRYKAIKELYQEKAKQIFIEERFWANAVFPFAFFVLCIGGIPAMGIFFSNFVAG